jgi:hypothetical protein
MIEFRRKETALAHPGAVSYVTRLRRDVDAPPLAFYECARAYLSCTRLWTYFRDGPSSERRPLSLAIGGQKKSVRVLRRRTQTSYFAFGFPLTIWRSPVASKFENSAKPADLGGRGKVTSMCTDSYLSEYPDIIQRQVGKLPQCNQYRGLASAATRCRMPVPQVRRGSSPITRKKLNGAVP